MFSIRPLGHWSFFIFHVSQLHWNLDTEKKDEEWKTDSRCACNNRTHQIPTGQIHSDSLNVSLNQFDHQFMLALCLTAESKKHRTHLTSWRWLSKKPKNRNCFLSFCISWKKWWFFKVTYAFMIGWRFTPKVFPCLENWKNRFGFSFIHFHLSEECLWFAHDLSVFVAIVTAAAAMD